MNFGFELIEVKLGKRASVYTIKIDGEDTTELDKFLSKKEVQNEKDALDFIVNRLYNTIPNKSAQKRYFDLNEGKAIDAVAKLKHAFLRCYCLRYGKLLVIAGSGGFKPEETRRRQDKKDLDQAVKVLQYVDRRIQDSIDDENFGFYDENGEITDDSKIRFQPL